MDTVRNTAKNFASTVSLASTAKHKVIIIDEADNTTNDVQLLLRAFTEEFSGNCRFILPATSKTKSLNHSTPDVPALISPLIESQNHNLPQRSSTVSGLYLRRRSVEADPKVLVELINKHFPDWRRVLNECQSYSSSGKIDAGILAQFSDVKVNDLIKHLKDKDFKEVRKWVVNNLDNDASVLLRRVYDALYAALTPNSIPAAVLVIAKYQYQWTFVADQEINMLACLTEIMVECEFK